MTGPGVSEPGTRFERPAALEAVLDVLRANQSRAREIGVEFVGVVGSVARGDEGPDSDVDVVYDVIREGHLWSLLGLVASMEDVLGRRIDLVDREIMPQDSWEWMARDLVRP